MPTRRDAQAGGLGERVVAVIVGLAAPDRQEHLLEQRAAIGEVDRLAEAFSSSMSWMKTSAAAVVADLEGALADDAEADVFEHRHAPRQRHRAAVVVDLQRRLVRLLLGMAVIVDGDRIAGADPGDAAGVGQRLGGAEGVAIAFRETARRWPSATGRRRRLAAASRSASSQVRTMSRIAASIAACSTFGVLPPERPMMKCTRASPPSGKAG